MSLAKKITINVVVQTLGKVFAAFIGLLTVALLARHLGEAGFGAYSTVMAFMGLVVVLADLGLYMIVVRDISKPGTDHEKILSNALGLRLVVTVVALLGGAVLALAFPYDPLVKKTMFVALVAFLFTSLSQVLIGIFQKHLVQYLTVIAETVGRMVNLALVYWFITQTMPLPYFFVALFLGNAATFYLTLLFARRYERFGISFDRAVWKALLISSWPLVFAVVLNLLYFKTDTVILSIFHSEKAVADYSLPYKILEGFLAFPAMFVGLIMPLLSAAAPNAWEKFRKILQGGFDALILMAIPMVIAAQYFADPLINLLKGKQDYVDSPALLRILILSAATIFIGTLFGYAVVAVDKQKAMIKGYLAGAIIGLILYFLLIPPFGYWGAAWATLATELVVALYAYQLVRKASGVKISFKVLIPSIPAVLALITFFQFFHFQWVLEIASGLVIYFLMLLLFRAIPAEFVKEVL